MYNVNNYSNRNKNNNSHIIINEAWYDYVPDVLKSGVKKLIGDDNYEAAKKMLIDSPQNTKKAEAAVDKLIKKKDMDSESLLGKRYFDQVEDVKLDEIKSSAKVTT